MKQTEHPKIFEDRGRFYTINLVKGVKVYGERLYKDRGVEYRQWDIKKSKLAAAIKKGIKKTGFKQGDVILYLGSASGTTTSHVSDIVGNKGLIFALEFAPRVMRDMLFMCKQRKNIAPILADAHQPEKYKDKMCMVDFIFQDIAQKDQAEIFIRNCDLFLKNKGLAMIAIKSRSIDITKKPRQIYKEVENKLKKNLEIIDFKTLDPFEKDHCVFLCKKR
tara:strand:- start:9375 stop:10034 length:660 start_codon:yes stop_codon:yes gene_type:complete